MHPIALNKNLTIKEIKNLLGALKLVDNKIYKIIFTYPNYDPNYQIILNQINHFMKSRANTKLIHHLGTKIYHSLMYYFGKDNLGICIGNSSSLIKEAPFFNCPSIIIGNRQKGRHSYKKIVFTQPEKEKITKKINEITKSFNSKTTPINFNNINLKKIIKKTIHLRSKKNFLLKKNFFE